MIRTEEDGRGLNARRSQFRIIDHRRNQFPVFDFGFEVVGFRDSLRGFRELLLDECPDFGVKGAHRAAHREDTGNDIREFVLPGVEGADTDHRGVRRVDTAGNNRLDIRHNLAAHRDGVEPLMRPAAMRPFPDHLNKEIVRRRLKRT